MKPSEHRCWKCAHLTMCGEYAVCNYFENTGKLRTWPEGPNGPWVRNSPTEPCPCYKRAKNGHGLNVVPALSSSYKEKPKEKTDLRKGPRCDWDYEKAKQMYMNGASIQEIAEAVGTEKGNISKYAYRYGWRMEADYKKRDKRKVK